MCGCELKTGIFIFFVSHSFLPSSALILDIQFLSFFLTQFLWYFFLYPHHVYFLHFFSINFPFFSFPVYLLLSSRSLFSFISLFIILRVSFYFSLSLALLFAFIYFCHFSSYCYLLPWFSFYSNDSVVFPYLSLHFRYWSLHFPYLSLHFPYLTLHFRNLSLYFPT